MLTCQGFPGGTWRICLRCQRPGFDPCVRKIPWRRKWQPTPVFLPGKPMDGGACWAAVHGGAESDTTEWLTLSVSLLPWWSALGGRGDQSYRWMSWVGDYSEQLLWRRGGEGGLGVNQTQRREQCSETLNDSCYYTFAQFHCSLCR